MLTSSYTIQESIKLSIFKALIAAKRKDIDTLSKSTSTSMEDWCLSKYRCEAEGH